MIRAYRISRATYASTMWSGLGAREAGGRWNSKGIAVVYAAQSRSLAALEQLVHLIPPRVLRGYVVASIDFNSSQTKRVDVGGLVRGWNAPVAPVELNAIGDRWVADGKFAVLAVPSVVVPGEWNHLFNPAHRAFAGMTRSSPEPFEYDSRLS